MRPWKWQRVFDRIAAARNRRHSDCRKGCELVRKLALLMALGLVFSLLSAAHPASAEGPTPAAPEQVRRFQTNSTVELPPDSALCRDLAANNAPCRFSATSVGTFRTVGGGAQAGPSPYMAGTTNYVCLYNSCANSGDGGSGSACGQAYTGTWSTYIHDSLPWPLNGYAWWSRVSYRFHGTTCQSVYFDSVDCTDHGGTGFAVSIDWCGTFNNGG